MAVATPCWPAPVSATTRVLPMRFTRSAWPSGVVDLVGAGVAEVLALQPHPAAEPLGEPRGEAEGRGPADVVAEEPLELRLEGRVAPRRRVGLLQLAERLHERLRDVAAAVGAEVAAGVRPDARVPRRLPRSCLPVPRREARLRRPDRLHERPHPRRVLAPGRRSRPRSTRPPRAGARRAIAAATFSGVSPPASIRKRDRAGTPFTSDQSNGAPRPPGQRCRRAGACRRGGPPPARRSAARPPARSPRRRGPP